MTSRTTLGAALTALLAATPAAAQRGPAQMPTNLPPDVIALACAPRTAFEEPDAPLRITGGQDSFVRMTYQPGDLITINAGSINGIEVGQEYYTRRVQVLHKQAVSRETPAVVATSGWIRVYAVDDEMSLATITHACDAVELDDFLEPFELPTVPTVATDRPKPERDNYARVVAGTDRREVFGKGDFLVVDRGSNEGVEPGTQFVLYRDKRADGNFLYDLGEAVAVRVSPDSSTLQVTVSRGAIQAGDYVSQRRRPDELAGRPE